MKQINWDRPWLAGANASAHADTHTHTHYLHVLSYCTGEVFAVIKLLMKKNCKRLIQAAGLLNKVVISRPA